MVTLHPKQFMQSYFKPGQRVYLVGIKGVAMTALAVWAYETGCKIFGSDVGQHFPTKDALDRIGVTPLVGFSPAHIEQTLPLDIVIYTGAHGGITNPEVERAQQLHIPIYAQGQALGNAMLGKKQISIAGCHGKTTTTAMVATIFTEANMDPSYAIGCGGIAGLGLPGHAGTGAYFIAEADEYITDPNSDMTPRFLWHTPTLLAVTNIDYDHPDVYGSLQEVQEAYKAFLDRRIIDGIAVVNMDDMPSNILRDVTYPNTITYGSNPEAMYAFGDIVFEQGKTVFSIITPDGTHTLMLMVPGRHNVSNATAAIAIARSADISWEHIAAGLKRFKGTRRRLEPVGERDGVRVIDDYAHHPKEIAASLAALREWYPAQNIVVIFQPHTYSRTKALLADFGSAFSHASKVAIAPIYSSARESPLKDITAERVADSVQRSGVPAFAVPTYQDVVQFLDRNTGPGDIAVFMGAGDINEWADTYAKKSEIHR